MIITLFIFINIFNETGDMLSLNVLQLKYGIHINFLIYYSIVSAIPRRWKFEIQKTHTVVDVSILHRLLGNVLKQSQGCWSIYNDLIEQSYSNITSNGARNGMNGSQGVFHWENGKIVSNGCIGL